MFKNKPVHTVPSGNGWANKQNGQVVSTHPNKAMATAAGKQQAQLKQTEHVIHNKNGQIGQKNSYGNDPFPPRDKK